MVRPPSYDTNGMKKGAWSEDEDARLRAHVRIYGHRNWRLVPIFAGLKRCGKSCRLRWVNYLKPGLRRGNFTQQEEDLIIQLHAELGNKWSAMAARINGRTDNEIKNHWHAHLKKHGSSRHNSAAAKTQLSKPNLCITRASDEYQQQQPKLENPKNVNLFGQVGQQQGDLSWAAGANYQTCYNPWEALPLPFVNQELDDLELVFQELDMLNNESNCSITGMSSSTAESQGSLSSNPFGEDDASYDFMIWGQYEA